MNLNRGCQSCLSHRNTPKLTHPSPPPKIKCEYLLTSIPVQGHQGSSPCRFTSTSARPANTSSNASRSFLIRWCVPAPVAARTKSNSCSPPRLCSSRAPGGTSLITPRRTPARAPAPPAAKSRPAANRSRRLSQRQRQSRRRTSAVSLKDQGRACRSALSVLKLECAHMSLVQADAG